MGLDDLLAPYSYIRGEGPPIQPRERSSMGLDMLTALAFGGSGQQRRKSPNPTMPTAGGYEELFYGGNQFNPSSVDDTHEGHLHFAKSKGIVKVGRKLENMGFDVGEHPKFGGVAPVHTSGSHHYSKDAIDVNYRGGGRWRGEPQALNWLERFLARKFG